MSETSISSETFYLPEILLQWASKRSGIGELEKCETIDVSLSLTRDNEYIASVVCPVRQCKTVFELMKLENRWTTSNYYRHVRGHKQLKENNSSVTNTLKNLFDHSESHIESLKDDDKIPSRKKMNTSQDESRDELTMITDNDEVLKKKKRR